MPFLQIPYGSGKNQKGLVLQRMSEDSGERR
jgi:hypothetical protein